MASTKKVSGYDIEEMSTWKNGDVLTSAALNHIQTNVDRLWDAVGSFNIVGSNSGSGYNLVTKEYLNYSVADGEQDTTLTPGALKTIASLSQIDGIIAPTYQEIPKASTSQFGVVKIGNNLMIDNEILTTDASPIFSGGLTAGSINNQNVQSGTTTLYGDTAIYSLTNFPVNNEQFTLINNKLSLRNQIYIQGENDQTNAMIKLSDSSQTSSSLYDYSIYFYWQEQELNTNIINHKDFGVDFLGGYVNLNTRIYKYNQTTHQTSNYSEVSLLHYNFETTALNIGYSNIATTINGTTTISDLSVSKFSSIPTYNPGANNRNYGVQTASNGSLYVQVPWTDGGNIPTYETEVTSNGDKYAFTPRSETDINLYASYPCYQETLLITNTNESAGTSNDTKKIIFQYTPQLDQLQTGEFARIEIKTVGDGTLYLYGNTVLVSGTPTFTGVPRIPALVFHSPNVLLDPTDDEVLTKADIQAIKTYCGIPLNNGGA